MFKKHYNSEYLVNTAQIMRGIKENSYKPLASFAGGRILDVGCGTGADVIQLAKIIPATSVVGLDHDTGLVAIGKENAKDLSNVQFFVGDVQKTPFDNQYFNAVRAERLIQHIKDPHNAFVEISRVLMPEGLFVIVETDWSSLNFYCGNVDTANKIIHFLTSRKVANGYASKKLYDYYTSSGFGNLHFEIHPLITDKLSDLFLYLWMDKIILEMVETQLLSSIEADLFLNELRFADEQGALICSMNVILAIGVKR